MDDSPSPAGSKPTQTPSWVMLGFVMGVLFMLALPRPEPAAPPRPEPAAPPVFADFEKYAVWDNDTTEVALWDSATKEYSDCYEVMRLGDAFFFRPIPRLTRPILRHGVPDAENFPLQFTVTAAQEREWRKAAQDETWRAVTDALHGASAKPKASP